MEEGNEHDHLHTKKLDLKKYNQVNNIFTSKSHYLRQYCNKDEWVESMRVLLYRWWMSREDDNVGGTEERGSHKILCEERRGKNDKRERIQKWTYMKEEKNTPKENLNVASQSFVVESIIM